MIECKVLRASKLRANEDYETRSYWPAYTLSLRVGDNPPIILRGWHYVTIDNNGDMEIADNDVAEHGVPRVVASLGHVRIITQDEDFEIDCAASCTDELEKAILDAVDSIDYVDPGE